MLVLFNFGVTHSFISSAFARKADIVPVSLNYEICVSTTNGSTNIVDMVCPSYTLSIRGHDLASEMVLEMKD